MAITVLEILCENIHPETVQNVLTICDHFDVITLHETMVDCYMLRKTKDSSISETARDTAIKTYNVLKHMEDFIGVDTVKTG